MAQCNMCKKEFVSSPWTKNGTCSAACLVRQNQPPPNVSVTCKACSKVATFSATSRQALTGFCSAPCLAAYNRNVAVTNILFRGTAPVAKYLNDQDLARLAQVDRNLNGTAMLNQLGPSYRREAMHYDSRRGEVKIAPDDMMNIALDAYRTALSLKAQNVPVILYRVSDKKKLTADQERVQTVAGAAKTAGNLWPVERTAAWIQGAMRARVPFLLLTDPRGPRNLKGGRDQSSDAVYVRELFQIIQTRYTIAKTEHITGRARVDVFMLAPPAVDTGPLPLVPRMSAQMSFDHTWNSSKPILTLGDPIGVISEFLVSQFTEAGTRLALGEY